MVARLTGFFPISLSSVPASQDFEETQTRVGKHSMEAKRPMRLSLLKLHMLDFIKHHEHQHVAMRPAVLLKTHRNWEACEPTPVALNKTNVPRSVTLKRRDVSVDSCAIHQGRYALG